MDKEVFQAIVNTFYCLDLTSDEKKHIITQWIIKAFETMDALDIIDKLDSDFDSTKPSIQVRVTLGNIIEMYRETRIWGDQKSYRGFIGTLIEEYSKIVKSRHDFMNPPVTDIHSISYDYRYNVASNTLISAVVEKKFKEALILVGLRSKEDSLLIANEWFNQVTDQDMSDMELSFCKRLRDTISRVSTKNTYSGTYNIERIKNLYANDDSDISWASVPVLIGIAQRVLTTFNGTRDSLVALLDYKGVDMSIEEIDSLIPQSSRSTYPVDMYQRVHRALELFF